MKLIKKTKLICTIGPTSESEEKLKQLISAGMTVARLNTSHGDKEEHGKRIKLLKKIRKELDLPISILLDTKGPEIRVHTFENKKIPVPKGKILEIVSNKEIIGNEDRFSISYKALTKTVKVGDKILFDDGKLSTVVTKVLKTGVKVRALNSHKLSNKKACNIPGVILELPFISNYDKDFIEYGLKNDVDYIAASFVNSAKDVQQIRDLLVKNKKEHVKIMSKIESKIAISNIDEIIEASDSIMIARGDLGVEIPYFEVPEWERIIIRKSRASSKPVVVATQMLDSMESNPVPTRAEVTDVTYAVLESADSTMLSGESANGSFPIESASVMAKITSVGESNFDFISASRMAEAFVKTSNAEVADFVAKKANNGTAKYIIAISRNGNLLRALSSYRPNAFILGITSNSKIEFSFGATYGIYINKVKTDLFKKIYDDEKKLNEIAKKWGAVKGDEVIVALPNNQKMLRVK